MSLSPCGARLCVTESVLPLICRLSTMHSYHYPAIFSLFYVLSFTAYAVEESSDQSPQAQPSRAVQVSGKKNSIVKNASDQKNSTQPAYISAQHLQGQQGGTMEATGAAELRQGNQAIFAEHLTFDPTVSQLTADGIVRIEQPGTIVKGSALQLNLDTFAGEMTQPNFQFTDIHARGSADSLHLIDKQNYLLHNVNYTTCPRDNDDWMLRLGVLEIDRNRQVGTAQHARVEFMSVPILYTPWMNFPLDDGRKTGFLAPIPGRTLKSGNEITVPFYWNIAPNYDATIAPRVMSLRGVILNNEFRYLEPAYKGEIHVDSLADDRLTQTHRLHSSLQHTHNLGNGLSAFTNINYVSDNDYFRDLATTISGTSQTNLERAGIVSYQAGWWNASLRTQSFQTLQDPVVSVVEPYRRMPQLSVNAQRTVAGANLTVTSEYVDFRHPTLINAQRLVLHPSISYPLVNNSAFYVTPKIGVHKTHYLFTNNNSAGLPNLQRTVPIYSLDSGMVFERNMNLAGQKLVQTLEPRAFYLRVPFRDQNQLPNFDTAQSGFSFAQMFSENRNHLTLALTSRLLQQDSGVERLRLTVGQRFNQSTPQASLTATPNKSDILFAATGHITPTLSLDSIVQYDPNETHSEKINFATRYQPESGKVINLGYRYTREVLKQVDVSAQWPLSKRWYALARWNYSLLDNRALESLAGLEYNDRCWTIRMVMQRFAIATNDVSTGIFVQLELNDLLRVGTDPLNVLRQSIPGFAKVNAIPNNDSLNNGTPPATP
jgi:LPS-assembly protein